MTLKNLKRGQFTHAPGGGRALAVAEIADQNLAIVAGGLANELSGRAGVKTVRVFHHDRRREKRAVIGSSFDRHIAL
jgi:hypothetical protein